MLTLINTIIIIIIIIIIISITVVIISSGRVEGDPRGLSHLPDAGRACAMLCYAMLYCAILFLFLLCCYY